MYRCVESSGKLLWWTVAPLLSCGCFIGCRLKGRDKGSFSLCHVSDITVNVPYFLIHSPIDGHLDYFQFWPVMSNVAMNICVQVFCVDTTFIYLWLVPRNRIADTYGKVYV